MTNNKEYLENFYIEYLSDLFRYSMFKLRNKENAEDVVSETFLRVLNKEGIENIENKKAWIISIARNVIYEKYRSENKNPYNSSNEIMDQIEEKNYDLEKEILDLESLEIIKKELDIIDEPTREVIILKIWEELGFNEIAEVVKENISTVKLRYYRGIEKLKNNINKNKYTYRTNTFSIPLLLSGVKLISSNQDYSLSNTLVKSLTNNLNLTNNLIFTKNNMDIMSSGMVAGSAKGLLATTGAKLAALILTTTVVLGTTAGVVTVVNNYNKAPVSYPVSYTSSSSSINSSSTSNSSLSSSVSSQSSSSDSLSDKKIVYVKENSNKELWLASIDGTTKKSLGVNNVIYSYKNPGSNIILYTTQTNQVYRSFIFNLNNNTTSEIIDHNLSVIGSANVSKNPYSLYGISFFSNNSASDHFNLNNIEPLSPNENIVLINLICQIACEDSNHQDRIRVGNYAYNIQTQSKVYLEKNLNLNNDPYNQDNSLYGYQSWDNNSQYIYTTKFSINSNTNHSGSIKQGNFKIDVANASEENITNIIGNYSKFEYYGPNSNIYTYQYQDNLVNKVKPLNLVLNKDSNNVTLASGYYQNIGREISVSPDNSKIIYLTDANNSKDADGNPNSQLTISSINPIKVNIKTISIGLNQRIAGNAVWVDNSYFIVQLIDGMAGTATKSNLYFGKIDSNELTALTNSDDILFKFNNKSYSYTTPCGYHDIWGLFCEAGPILGR